MTTWESIVVDERLLRLFIDGQPPGAIRPRSETPEAKIIEALSRYTNRSGVQLAEMTGLGAIQLYPAIVRLERDGVIESYCEMPPRGRRRYRIVKHEGENAQNHRPGTHQSDGIAGRH